MYLSTTLILLVTVLDILVYYLQKLQEQDNGEQKISASSSSLDIRSMHEEDHGERKDPSLSSSSLYKQCLVFSLAEIKLATNDFDDAFVIGKGGSGQVYKGKIDFEAITDVAIKRLDCNSNQGETEFRAEIEMLSKIRHSHIVSLLGYCETDMILVYEYMPNGSLEDHLHKKRANTSSYSPLTWVQRLNICIGAARGLDYLHTGTGVQYRVIYRDVKSSNILLDENLAGKIADFGLSRITPASQSGSTTNVYTGQIVSTFGYMDAEYFSTHRLTRKSDVYAFGVVLLEVLCGRPALDVTLDEEQHSLAGWGKHCIKRCNISRIVDPCLRGQVSVKCLKKFGQIAYECLRTCSKERPTMTVVLARLELVLTWTMQSPQGASNWKNIAWSLFLTKTPSKVDYFSFLFFMSLVFNSVSILFQAGRVISERKKDNSDNGGVATASQQAVLHTEGTIALNLKEFTYSELQTATHNFEFGSLIGEGGFGKVFKGWLDRVTYTSQKAGDWLPVAIKKLNPESMQGLKEWQAEVNFLGKFSHPNIVKLLGYCQKNMELLIVYEYMQRGSLDNHLFRKRAEALPWSTRIKIAIGVAQGLAYLHTTGNNVICRDVKTSNVLLDKASKKRINLGAVCLALNETLNGSDHLLDFNAKLSDFGIAKLGPPHGESYVSTRVAGTYGYAAPEYVGGYCDVYGFGVVMLEIITGLRALDPNRHAMKRNLVEWARPFLLSNKKRIQRVMDPRLEQNYPSKAACKAAKLILTCLEHLPENRPSMEEVVSHLEGINAIIN
ncbi:putative transferase, protein kinase RLK-Pelle-CrRLK1L-1 family [Helianthus annuus]|nr:putative transferase, protein kinase RLK-Pelle-CrRLK1L-1 family [Helianthus annuus]